MFFLLLLSCTSGVLIPQEIEIGVILFEGVQERRVHEQILIFDKPFTVAPQVALALDHASQSEAFFAKVHNVTHKGFVIQFFSVNNMKASYRYMAILDSRVQVICQNIKSRQNLVIQFKEYLHVPNSAVFLTGAQVQSQFLSMSIQKTTNSSLNIAINGTATLGLCAIIAPTDTMKFTDVQPRFQGLQSLDSNHSSLSMVSKFSLICEDEECLDAYYSHPEVIETQQTPKQNIKSNIKEINKEVQSQIEEDSNKQLQTQIISDTKQHEYEQYYDRLDMKVYLSQFQNLSQFLKLKMSKTSTWINWQQSYKISDKKQYFNLEILKSSPQENKPIQEELSRNSVEKAEEVEESIPDIYAHDDDMDFSESDDEDEDEDMFFGDNSPKSDLSLNFQVQLHKLQEAAKLPTQIINQPKAQKKSIKQQTPIQMIEIKQAEVPKITEITKVLQEEPKKKRHDYLQHLSQVLQQSTDIEPNLQLPDTKEEVIQQPSQEELDLEAQLKQKQLEEEKLIELIRKQKEEKQKKEDVQQKELTQLNDKIKQYESALFEEISVPAVQKLEQKLSTYMETFSHDNSTTIISVLKDQKHIPEPIIEQVVVQEVDKEEYEQFKQDFELRKKQKLQELKQSNLRLKNTVERIEKPKLPQYQLHDENLQKYKDFFQK